MHVVTNGGQYTLLRRTHAPRDGRKKVFATSLPRLALNLLTECQKYAGGGRGLCLPDEDSESEDDAVVCMRMSAWANRKHVSV